MGPACAFALLGISANASEADVRRAYARKLKDFRPDEDPEGFQRLVSARDAALAWARQLAKAPAPDSAEPESARPAIEEEAPEPSASSETAGKASTVPQALEAQLFPPKDAPYPPPDGKPQVSPAPAARETEDFGEVLTPSKALDTLRLGLKRLIEEKTAFDVRGLEAMLLKLPAGAGRSIEHASILELSRALPFLRGPVPYPLAAEELLERLGVMLTDHFGWQDNDRALFEALTLEGAARFELFLRTAHEMHAPGKEMRFAKPEPVAANREARKGGSNAWIYVVVIMISALARIGLGPGVTTHSDEARDYMLKAVQEQLQYIKELEEKLVFDAGRDLATALADYEEQKRANGLHPLRLLNQAVDSYIERGKAEDIVFMLDLAIASKSFQQDRNGLKALRGTAWLRTYGWSDRGTCKRRNPARDVNLGPTGEAAVRQELQDALDAAKIEQWAGDALIARLLELSDHLIGQKRFGDADAILNQAGEIAARPPLQESNVQVEVAAIRRCLFPIAHR